MRFFSLPTALSPLAVPRLRRLFIAQVPADLADWLDFVALAALLTFHWNLGPAALASLTLALALPYVVLAPLIGVLVDRSDQRTLLIASNFLRAVATAAFAIAPNLPILLLLVIAKSGVDAVFTPAKQATIPLLSPPNGLMAANSLSHTINQVTKVAGPALGGGLVVLLNPQQIFLANASLSLIAALILLGLPSGLRHAREATGSRGFRREFVDGLVLIRRRPLLLTAIVTMGIGFFLIFLYDGLISLLIKQTGYSDAMLGISVAATGAGGVLGALLLGQFGARRDPLRLMATGGIGCGLLIAVTGHVGRGDLVMSPMIFCLLQFVIGVTSACLFVPYRTVLQKETPPESLGRVTAVGEAVSAIGITAAPPLGAVLAGVAGVPAPYLLSGYLTVTLAVVLLAYRQRIASHNDTSG
ncbi:MFS transporter [Phyllobacterium sp. P30BS-XVII]|uniref:MFS transporter n=1 Tax=Phyllobacterium sp. P30BS-XVII TaxID=2587046 RepID=UPI0015FC4179|nr:MFS transporter [Phyllobacterium sp. P30BS-XVII]MBA8900867.1 MFS family permease [Phyllobacterium sp. P30BS-XVII]